MRDFSLHMSANKRNLSDVGGLNEVDLKAATYGFCSSGSRQADESGRGLMARLVSCLEPIQCKEIPSDATDRKWIAWCRAQISSQNLFGQIACVIWEDGTGWCWRCGPMIQSQPLTSHRSQRGYSRGVITAYVSGGLIRAVNGYIEVGWSGAGVESSAGFMDQIQPNICGGRDLLWARNFNNQPSFLKQTSDDSVQVLTPDQHRIINYAGNIVHVFKWKMSIRSKQKRVWMEFPNRNKAKCSIQIAADCCDEGRMSHRRR